MRRFAKVLLVWTVAILMLVDTATACRLLGRARRCRPVCCEPCPPVSCCGDEQPVNPGKTPPAPPVETQKPTMAEQPLEKPTLPPEDTTPAMPPVDTTPKVDTPPTTPEVTAPEKTAPDATAPETMTPDATAPKVTQPETTTPDATTPDATPEKTTPEKTTPDDIFDPPAEKPAETPANPGNEKPADPVTPPNEKPAETPDDLFGDTPAEKPADSPAETPATETPATETPTTETPATETPATDTPAEKPTDSPMTPTETPDDLFGDKPADTTTPPAEAPATETPAAEAPATDTPAESPMTPAEAPDDLFGDKPADAPADTPAADTPAAETPATDTPATETPATDAPKSETPADDLFGDNKPMEDEPVADAATAAPEATPEAKPRNPTNSDEAPMDAVADNKPTIDDLFGDGTPGSALRDDAPAGNSPMTEAPATEVPADAAPVGEPADEAPAEEPAAEGPATEAPADAPATEEKPADVDDLFGDAKGDTPKIRRAPAVKPRETLAPQGEFEPSHIEPLVAPPTGTTATPPSGKRTKVDDLFAGPEKKQPNKNAGPAIDPPVIAPDFTTPRAEAPIQAPLVPQAEPVPRVASVPAKAVSLPMRVDGVIRDWKDDTGSYGVRGRLVSILEGKVRIQKSTGKYTTVPFDRLSKGDLDYVSGMAEASGLELAIAQVKNAKK